MELNREREREIFPWQSATLFYRQQWQGDLAGLKPYQTSLCGTVAMSPWLKKSPSVFCSHSSIIVCEINWKSKLIPGRITATHSKFLFILSWSQLDFPFHALYQCTSVEIQSTRLPSCSPSKTSLYSYILNINLIRCWSVKHEVILLY